MKLQSKTGILNHHNVTHRINILMTTYFECYRTHIVVLHTKLHIFAAPFYVMLTQHSIYVISLYAV